ncbi:MAG: hypothetical protein M3Y55_04185 [Pseudomonadota bacterium]|nr:hypothetical protein [Pseudomonadota bacterium]
MQNELGHASIRTTSGYLITEQGSAPDGDEGLRGRWPATSPWNRENAPDPITHASTLAFLPPPQPHRAIAKKQARRQIPATANVDTTDPALLVDLVCGRPRTAPSLEFAMSNSFAFGGTNAVLIVRRDNGEYF